MDYEIVEPESTIVDFVERFWALRSGPDKDLDLVVIPDGRIDLIFTISRNETFRAGLIGIETVPSKHTFPAGTIMFGVSLKLLAVEYLLQTSIAGLVNGLQLLPDNFRNVVHTDLSDLKTFSEKLTNQILSLISAPIDGRKKKLFDLLYVSNGSMPVKVLAESVAWSSRQINRYFVGRFGISLKSYCMILRFRASFAQIKEGRLFPEQNFADQAHFIREVKKLSGVSPKELFKNQNDRFIQFSTLSGK